MLSRVAERLYWLARHMERAENTARLVNVYSNLLLDLPKGSKVGWETLIHITGGDKVFEETFKNKDEANVSSFLIAQKSNMGSILNSLIMARENARTTREIIPAEAWELINDLYLYAQSNAAKSSGRSSRQVFLKRVINSSFQLTGLLSGCMSHNHAYDFMVMGRNLERADMTSRIIDVGVASLMNHAKNTIDIIPYENSLWMNVLRSLNGYQMYRQHVQDRVNGEDVVDFLLLDPNFPRTVLHCLNRLVEAAGQLPNNENSLRTVAATQRKVRDSKFSELLDTNTQHDFIDQIQLEFATIHNEIASTWFLKPVELQQQTQTNVA